MGCIVLQNCAQHLHIMLTDESRNSRRCSNRSLTAAFRTRGTMCLMSGVDICPHFEAYLPTCGICEGEKSGCYEHPC